MQDHIVLKCFESPHLEASVQNTDALKSSMPICMCTSKQKSTQPLKNLNLLHLSLSMGSMLKSSYSSKFLIACMWTRCWAKQNPWIPLGLRRCRPKVVCAVDSSGQIQRQSPNHRTPLARWSSLHTTCSHRGWKRPLASQPLISWDGLMAIQCNSGRSGAHWPLAAS